jgi:hypothetical protein
VQLLRITPFRVFHFRVKSRNCASDILSASAYWGSARSKACPYTGQHNTGADRHPWVLWDLTHDPSPWSASVLKNCLISGGCRFSSTQLTSLWRSLSDKLIVVKMVKFPRLRKSNSFFYVYNILPLFPLWATLNQYTAISSGFRYKFCPHFRLPQCVLRVELRWTY